METAPIDGQTITIKTATGAIVRAFWAGGLMNGSEEDCGGWHALHEGEHPECWTDGICWESNENEQRSDPPVTWIR